MSSIANVWLPQELRDPFRAAVKHYGFETAAGFFRICALSLIKHHQRGEQIQLPLSFHDLWRLSR
jgi:hypothetical protein